MAWSAGAGVIVVAVGLGVGLTLASRPASPALALISLSGLGHLQAPGPLGPPGPEGVPIPAAPTLASTASAATGQTVDGIECQTSEQVLFHIHAHLAIFVNGVPRQVPYGLGIVQPQTQNTPEGPFVTSGTCFYWLHTHAADGIIHIESPVAATYTLGEFFDIWGEPLAGDRVGPSIGPVVALFNGRRYTGNIRNIPLEAHAEIQLDVGRPLVAPESTGFPSGL